MACLKTLISRTVFLVGSLRERWFNILEVLQNTDHALSSQDGQHAGGTGEWDMLGPSAAGAPVGLTMSAASATGANAQAGVTQCFRIAHSASQGHL